MQKRRTSVCRLTQLPIKNAMLFVKEVMVMEGPASAQTLENISDALAVSGGSELTENQ